MQNVKINLTDIAQELLLPKFRECYTKEEKYLVLGGGGCSGKSYSASIIAILKALENDSKIVVIRKYGNSHQYSTLDSIQSIIKLMDIGNLFEVNNSKMVLKCKSNNSEIIFTHPDDFWVSVKLKDASLVWMEEATEFTKTEFNWIDKIVGKKAQIIMTFNPISTRHWIKQKFFDNENKDAYVLMTTYKDNKYASENLTNILEKFIVTSPYYHHVYCKGEWGELKED